LGLVATAGCEDYLTGTIKKHELTRPDKEDDRLRHIETLGAQTGPVFLVYRSQPALEQFLVGKTTAAPAVDFKAADGVRHTAWIISDAASQRRIEAEFAEMRALYIADGHHRCAAAARVYQEHCRSGCRDGSPYFLSVIFPQDQVQILPYHRTLKDLNGCSP